MSVHLSIILFKFDYVELSIFKEMMFKDISSHFINTLTKFKEQKLLIIGWEAKWGLDKNLIKSCPGSLTDREYQLLRSDQ